MYVKSLQCCMFVGHYVLQYYINVCFENKVLQWSRVMFHRLNHTIHSSIWSCGHSSVIPEQEVKQVIVILCQPSFCTYISVTFNPLIISQCETFSFMTSLLLISFEDSFCTSKEDGTGFNASLAKDQLPPSQLFKQMFPQVEVNIQ